MIRITKRQAQARFNQGKPIILCPCKFYPGGPFSMGWTCYPKEYLEKAEWYRNDGTLWKGSIELTAWDLMFNNWAFYNASYETGYYPHYYIEKGWEQ